MEFKPFPKIPRLSRECVITEKIDGTNASVTILDCQDPEVLNMPNFVAHLDGFYVYAGSRNRFITPTTDNAGFASWVKEHVEELIELGPGTHFGEWWGRGIQRGYNQIHKRFSLFNVSKWSVERPACCDCVPVLWEGLFSTWMVDDAVSKLRESGSLAAPGYPFPEGVVVYHKAGNLLFKKTLEKDEEPKNARLHQDRVFNKMVERLETRAEYKEEHNLGESKGTSRIFTLENASRITPRAGEVVYT